LNLHSPFSLISIAQIVFERSLKIDGICACILEKPELEKPRVKP